MKTNLTMSIDVEVAKAAQKKFDNLSATVETFLREECGLQE